MSRQAFSLVRLANGYSIPRTKFRMFRGTRTASFLKWGTRSNFYSMTTATLNGAPYGSIFPASLWVQGWVNDAAFQRRAREMREQPAFARSARWVGPAHEGIAGDIETATQLVAGRNFGEIPKRRPMANRIIERGLRIRILTGFTLVILLILLIAGWSYYHISP